MRKRVRKGGNASLPAGLTFVVVSGSRSEAAKMTKKIVVLTDASPEQIEIIVGALHLCLQYAVAHIVKAEGAASAGAFKEKLVTALESGDIDMSILDDAKTFDFVVGMVKSLATVDA
jgi:hypothetical protein